MKPIRYSLVVNEPGSYDTWASFDASTPFMNINVGDYINPGMWPRSEAPMKVLKVTKIMHSIYEHEDETRHVVAVFGEEVERVAEFERYH